MDHTNKTDFDRLVPRYADRNCDGRLESGEYLSLVRESANALIDSALSNHRSEDAATLRTLSRISQEDLKRDFVAFRDAEGRRFVAGIETPTAEQFRRSEEILHRRSVAAVEAFPKEGVADNVYYDIKSFLENARLGFRLKLAGASLELSDDFPSAWPSCGAKQVRPPTIR